MVYSIVPSYAIIKRSSASIAYTSKKLVGLKYGILLKTISATEDE